MLKQIASKLEKMAEAAREKNQAIADQFDHPIAKVTEWSPIKSGGANFKTAGIVVTPNHQLKVKKSVGGKLFYGLFGLIGFGVLSILLISILGIGPSDLQITELAEETGAAIGMLIFGFIFFLVGVIPLTRNKNLVFDKAEGYCWEGNKSPRDVIRAEEIEKLIRLERIQALQLIKERISSSDSSYYSYELNLVLDDGSRVNVLDHGSLKSVREDAEILSKYLEVPVLDAC